MFTSITTDKDAPATRVVGTSAVNGHGRAHILLPGSKVTSVISAFRPTKIFRRQAEDKPTSILSLDFDDLGELLMTSESDESIQIYNVKDGKHQKSCLSKKYGVAHAKFTHATACIVYASTRENNVMRYLSTHDNSFIRYFAGHEAPVTCIAMNPGGADTFLSCAEDDTVRMWDTNSSNSCGKLLLHRPYLAAWDPSANVIAVASESTQTILLYDFRNYDKEPFATFDILEKSYQLEANSINRNWNKLEFSNDGKSLLLGTSGHTLFVLDAFDGEIKAALRRGPNGPARLAAGQHPAESSEIIHPTSGNACFSPDGRYVLAGSRGENVLVWDTLQPIDVTSSKPTYVLEMKTEAAVLAYNPRYNFLASADKEVVFWLPDLASQN